MKKFLISFPVLFVVLLSPFSVSHAYSDYYPSTPLSQTSPFNGGGTMNPINVQVEPTAQYRNQNLEASLKTQYGSSAFYSCMNRIPSCNGDTSNPSNQYACLQAIQYNFESGRCRSTSNTPVPTYTQPTPVFYPAYVNPPKQQGPSCGEGTLLVGSKCVSYSESCRISYGTHTYGDKEHCYCDAGYEWSADGKICVQSISIHINNSPTGETFGGSGGGGSGGSGGYVPPVDTNDAEIEQTSSQVVVKPESQTASLALLADWQAPAVEESKPEPRRGFWSWLLSLFGF